MNAYKTAIMCLIE